MKTLIVFASRYGAVLECAEKLKGLLDGEADLLRIGKTIPIIDLSRYDTVLIGGSVHLGKLQAKLLRFCSGNLDALRAKKLGLFLSTLTTPEKAGRYFDELFPPELLKAAKVKASFGGKVTFEVMNPIDQLVLKGLAKTDKSFSRISDDGIASFAEAIKRA